ncbi:MAG: hypothetical protein PCFJNLEI_01922 [Verrucomicrobiae bacterium]|nr:hypothetical protein [Verrucomicrobiae bacterium]
MKRPKYTPPHKTLFDSLTHDSSVNVFCNVKDLTNEASVETFFVNRLLTDLGYKDGQIKAKTSISEMTVSLGGSKSARYKPDYILTYRKLPRWLIDAKSPKENIDDWIPQCSAYCLGLNQRFPNANPVEKFVLTNGLHTKVFDWDNAEPILELDFADFVIGNPKFEQLRAILAASVLSSPTPEHSKEGTVAFHRPTPEQARQIFAQCHRTIWKSEVCSPTAAFMEFTKLMFVKLWADRQLRADRALKAMLNASKDAKLPKSSVTFSVHWIEANEKHTENPVNGILFNTLRDEIEKDIAFRRKKRIFEKNERIDLKPDTVKAVVRRLQNVDMFGIDEDLNGRLFETFLSATMRGRELGQFFTPRSVVKLMVRMADLNATKGKMDKVIDACCGSGGFLIEVLTEMRNRIRANKTLSITEKNDLIEQLANECLYGLDFGKSPPIARIARINMYLHGDGGSRIYYADALDKDFELTKGQDAEVLENQQELKEKIAEGLRFDAVLTNPPFSMTKELRNETEKRILGQYDLAKVEGTTRLRSSLRSSAMFIERYRDLLRPGGMLFTVIDDTLLASDDFKFVRNFIRKEFIVRGIVSLPGDAFRRSGARVKTSILCLQRKTKGDEAQTPVFYAFSEKLGVDDLTPRASSDQVAIVRREAEIEIAKIVSDFGKYMSGDAKVDTVSAERVQDRFDLKYVVPLQGRYVKAWKQQGIDVCLLSDVAKPVREEVAPHSEPEKEFALLMVTYNGYCQVYRRTKGKSIKPPVMLRVHTGDLLFSNIRATDGAIGIVTAELDGALASESFTILRAKNQVDGVYLWNLLRTYEIRADMMSPSTGTGRYNTDWDLAAAIQIPWLPAPDRKRIANAFLKSWQLERKVAALRQKAEVVITPLQLNGEASKKRFDAYKPPK